MRARVLNRAIAGVLCASLALASSPASALAKAPNNGEDTAAKSSQASASKLPAKASVRYKVDYKGVGWSPWKKNGKAAGKAKWSGELQRLRVEASGPYTGGIKYKVRLAGAKKWQAWSKNGAEAGKNTKAAEAVKVKLTGKLAKHYHVYYKVYSADRGWLGWARDGQHAGTGTHRYPIGALRVVLVKKGSAAPGSTKAHYTVKKTAKGGKWAMANKARKLSSKTKWLIVMSRDDCWVGVFKGKKGAWKLKKRFRCSCGKPSTPTPKGTFKIGQRFTPLVGNSTEYWAIHVTGYVHFHSILYYHGTHTVKDGRLGMHISAGCIRLAYKNAKWMYKTLPDNTKCVIY